MFPPVLGQRRPHFLVDPPAVLRGGGIEAAGRGTSVPASPRPARQRRTRTPLAVRVRSSHVNPSITFDAPPLSHRDPSPPVRFELVDDARAHGLMVLVPFSTAHPLRPGRAMGRERSGAPSPGLEACASYST